jgi:hypothetical protein
MSFRSLELPFSRLRFYNEIWQRKIMSNPENPELQVRVGHKLWRNRTVDSSYRLNFDLATRRKISITTARKSMLKLVIWKFGYYAREFAPLSAQMWCILRKNRPWEMLIRGCTYNEVFFPQTEITCIHWKQSCKVWPVSKFAILIGHSMPQRLLTLNRVDTATLSSDTVWIFHHARIFQ